MDRFSFFFNAASAINLLAPLIPISAVILHHRSDRYMALAWMNRLVLLLAFGLVVNWTMLGTSWNGLRNNWIADLSYFPEVLLTLWVLDGVGPSPIPRIMFWPGIVALGMVGAMEAAQLGLQEIWPLTASLGSAFLLAICFWRLFGHFIKKDTLPMQVQPSFWMLTSWAMIYAIDLTFLPLYDIFLRHLSKEWILVPWFVKYAMGLVLNLGLARTFLCPKPSSS